MSKKISAGQLIYEVGTYPCLGVGLKWLNEELEDAIDNRVSDLVFDDVGTSELEAILSSVAETDFASEELDRVLNDPTEVENWRVGEAIGEAYLTDHRSCQFPWPDTWDEKKRRSSLPGADLIGFGEDEDGDCFAFGEVKTSSDPHYPPSTMYGRTGLKQQLKDLRDNIIVRDDLVKYIGHRAIRASWRSRFEHAGKRYLQNSSDFLMFGILVRDVSPNSMDLQKRVHDLNDQCPNGTRIELIALYLPQRRLIAIGKDLITRRKGSVK